MQQTTVTNMPNVVLWVIALALIVFSLSAMAIAVVAIPVLSSLKNMLDQMNGMLKVTEGKLPAILESWQRR